MNIHSFIYVLGMVISNLITIALWFYLLKPRYSRIWILIINVSVVMFLSVIKIKSPSTNNVGTVVVPLLSIAFLVISAVVFLRRQFL